jgi:hypothetical protein
MIRISNKNLLNEQIRNTSHSKLLTPVATITVDVSVMLMAGQQNQILEKILLSDSSYSEARAQCTAQVIHGCNGGCLTGTKYTQLLS